MSQKDARNSLTLDARGRWQKLTWNSLSLSIMYQEWINRA
jgi:hypothetical protein